MKSVTKVTQCLVLALLTSSPALAFSQEDDHSAEKLLNLSHYESAIEKIENATDDSTIEEFVDYMQTYTGQNPQSALSRFSGEKLKKWSKGKASFLFPEEMDHTQASEVSTSNDETELTLSVDPLRERARLRVKGSVQGHIELAQHKHTVSIDLYDSLPNNLKLRFQRQTDSLEKRDQLHLYWQF